MKRIVGGRKDVTPPLQPREEQVMARSTKSSAAESTATDTPAQTETAQVTITLADLAQREHVSDRTRQRFAEQAEAGVVNPIVLAQLLGVKPQMIYNYLRKGRFSEQGHEEAVSTNSTQKKVIRLDEANAFAASYFTRKVEREAAREARVQAELQGEVGNK